MKIVSGLFLLLTLATSACISKSRANAQAQAAFSAGQQQAAAQAKAGPSVNFRGDVKKSRVPWAEGLTLTKALLVAEYTGFWEPHSIVIMRKGETFKINVKGVLKGLEDPLMEPDDTVEVHR